MKRYLKLRSTELHSGIHWAYWPKLRFLFTYNVHLLTLAAVRFLATIIWRANTKSFVSHNTVHCSSCLLSKEILFFFFSVQEFFLRQISLQDFFSPWNLLQDHIFFKSPIPSLKVKWSAKWKKILALILGASSRFSFPRSKNKDLYSEKHRQTNS